VRSGGRVIVPHNRAERRSPGLDTIPCWISIEAAVAIRGLGEQLLGEQDEGENDQRDSGEAFGPFAYALAEPMS
jgi:hypothetical protein